MTVSSSSSKPLYARFDEFELDEANARLLRSGNAIPLSPTPFKLLCALVQHPGSLLTKHALLDEVWGHRFVSDSVLKGAISDVRIALGDDAQRPRFIETAPRRGYRFIAVLTKRSSGDETSASAHASADEPNQIFIGRKRELGSLARAWDRVTQGRRVVFWIAGEPGIGKTTLVDRFVSGLHDVACARGHCVQHYGSGEPYHPVLEALAELSRTDTTVPPLLRAVAPTWLLQLPWLSTAEQRESLLRELVGVNLERMLREMGEFLDRYTERRPLLLVTEDLHWGDRATIQLIDYIARRRGPGRVMWLSSFRLAEIVASEHPLSSLRHELHLHDLCEEIVLDSFSEAEVAAYLVERSPTIAGDESLVRAIHERTEGVPLFVASLTGDVTARSAQGDAATAALLASSPVPQSLFAIIDHHLAKLESERRVLLSAAAVCGLDFRIDTLALVLELDALNVADTCDRLLRDQVWLVASRAAEHRGGSSERPYSFRHALFRQALYERLMPSMLAELHRKVGLALEQQRSSNVGVAAAELAMHFDRGRAPLAALRYYVEAAEAALLHVSPSECMSLTERALTLLDQAPAGLERTSLEVSLATLRGVAAFHLLGAGDETRRAYQRGSALLDAVPQHPMRALLLHGFGFLLNLRAEYADALVTAERAEALGTEAGDPLLMLAACTARAQAYMHQGRPEAACEWLQRALPMAEAVNAGSQQTFIGFIADPQVTVLSMLSLPLTHLGRIKEARKSVERAYARAHRLSQPMALLVTMWFDALGNIRLGDVSRVATLADEMHSLVEKFALAQGTAACRWFRAWADARQGKPEAFKQIRAAYEQNTALGMIAGGSETLGYAAEALILNGDCDGAEEQLRQAFDIVSTRGERIYLPQLFLAEAAIARARGQLAGTEASIRRAITEARTQGSLWLELLAQSELCQYASATADDRHTLRSLVTRLSDGVDAPALTKAKAVL